MESAAQLHSRLANDSLLVLPFGGIIALLIAFYFYKKSQNKEYCEKIVKSRADILGVEISSEKLEKSIILQKNELRSRSKLMFLVGLPLTIYGIFYLIYYFS